MSSYSLAEVAKHKDDASGFWLVVENQVYDVTSTPAYLCISV
jgi:cytochrome b involved in lipid metabolism